MDLYAPEKVLSLLTTIRNVYRAYEQNIISGLSMIFHKVIRAYCFNPRLPCRNRVSTVHVRASFVASHSEALTFTGHWPQTYCVVSGASYQRWFSNSTSMRTHWMFGLRVLPDGAVACAGARNRGYAYLSVSLKVVVAHD